MLTFSGLRSDEAQDLLRFLGIISANRSACLTGSTGYWIGVIMTPDDPVVQDGKDSFSASFEFEGELDPDGS